MQGTIGRLGPLVLEPGSFKEFGNGVIVGRARWAAADAPEERWIVLSTNGHEITDMKVCSSRRKALQLATRRRGAAERGGS